MQVDEDIQIHIEPILDNSSKLYVFLNGERYEDAGNFSTIMTITPKPDEPGAVIIHGALGQLSDAINIKIGKALQAEGYHTAYFEVSRGNRVSRRAGAGTHAGNFDLYPIDLNQEV